MTNTSITNPRHLPTVTARRAARALLRAQQELRARKGTWPVDKLRQALAAAGWSCGGGVFSPQGERPWLD